jgi:hypothetical protein
MFGLGRHNDDVLYGVLIDVGSGSVGVAIVESDVNQKSAKLVFSHRVFMRVSKRNQSPDERIRLIREALFSASLILTKDGLDALRSHAPDTEPSHLFVTCMSPWSQISSRSINYAQDEEFRVTTELFEDLLASAESEAESAIDAHESVGQGGFAVVERATVNVRINDYSVLHPIGLKGTEVSLSHVTGLMPNAVLDAVGEVRDKLFPKCTIHPHTSMLVSFTVLRDLMPNLSSFGIIDVSAEATEIGIVSDEVLREVEYASMGSNTLIRAIAKGTEGTPGDAIGLLAAYADDRLSLEAKMAIDVKTGEYVNAFTEAVGRISERTVMPETLFVSAHMPLEAFFTHLVEQSLNEISKRPQRITMVTKLLPANETAEVDKKDTYLTISSYFFHKVHRSGKIHRT